MTEVLPGEQVIASFGARLLAHLVDFFLTNAAEFGVEYGLTGIVFLVRKFGLHEQIDYSHAMDPIVEQVISGIFGLGLAYWYYVPYQLKHGSTIGKKLFSIYVIDEKSGAPMTVKQARIRLLSYIPSYIILGCGFLMAAFNPKRRALHDMIAGTICVQRKPATST